MSTGCSASAHPPAVAACPVAHLPPAPRSMSLDQLAGAITRGRLRGLTSDQGAEACWLSCSAAVFYSYRSAGDYLLYLLDCGSREAVQLGRPVPFPPGQPGYEEMRGMAAANVAQGLRMARVGYPGVIVYQSEDHHLMAFRRSLVLLFDARPTARPPTGGPPTDRPAPAPGGSSPAPRPVAWWRPPWGCNAHTHTARHSGCWAGALPLLMLEHTHCRRRSRSLPACISELARAAMAAFPKLSEFRKCSAGDRWRLRLGGMPSEMRLRGSRSRGGLKGARGARRGWDVFPLGGSPWGGLVPPAGICRQLVSWICTIATSTIPPLRGPTQSRPSRSPPSIPHLLSPS
jgi:hypothetical protein